jgi:hypothetical protein
MKFKNLKFPEFPSVSKFKLNSAKSNEIRMKKFMELFDIILLYA